jgi:hypothetical protein
MAQAKSDGVTWRGTYRGSPHHLQQGLAALTGAAFLGLPTIRRWTAPESLRRGRLEKVSEHPFDAVGERFILPSQVPKLVPRRQIVDIIAFHTETIRLLAVTLNANRSNFHLASSLTAPMP